MLLNLKYTLYILLCCTRIEKKDLKKTNRTEKLQCLQTAVEIEKPLVLIEIQFQKSHFVLYDFRTQTSDLSNRAKKHSPTALTINILLYLFSDLQEPNP